MERLGQEHRGLGQDQGSDLPPASSLTSALHAPTLGSSLEWIVTVHIMFNGEFGHTFMEFVTNSGDYCQAQHLGGKEDKQRSHLEIKIVLEFERGQGALRVQLLNVTSGQYSHQVSKPCAWAWELYCLLHAQQSTSYSSDLWR
ncbi:hypothetical protein RRG08_002454 [Elysia crispata]|uniref:Uncharacterized protein n=1 Tax=Elysia crispata TaxID=231223 RepID=A0AAE1DUH8_9GAST|nr:hypothetical protein RRG08_002454 [Elysia crispata]